MATPLFFYVMVHSSPRRTSHKPVAGTCVHTHLTTTCVCASNMAVVGAIIEYRDCATHDLFTPEGHKMVKRCTIALLDKRLPHGLCRQFRSQDGRPPSLEISSWCIFQSSRRASSTPSQLTWKPRKQYITNKVHYK